MNDVTSGVESVISEGTIVAPCSSYCEGRRRPALPGPAKLAKSVQGGSSSQSWLPPVTYLYHPATNITAADFCLYSVTLTTIKYDILSFF